MLYTLVCILLCAEALLNDLDMSRRPYFTLEGLYGLFGAAAGITAVYIACLYAAGLLDYKEAIWIIFVAGTVLRICYTLFTGAGTRTYDVYRDQWGHLDYIKYVAENFSLPPVNTCQAYHPPVHYFISAFAYNTGKAFSENEFIRLKFIQLAATALNSLTLFFAYGIIKGGGLSGWPLVTAFSSYAFHPAGIYLASRINNDNTMLFFYTAGLYFLLRWRSDKSAKSMLLLSICLPLAVLSKKSAIMLFVPAAAVFTASLLNSAPGPDGSVQRRSIRQIAAFCLITIPLSMSHNLRNYLLFGQSFNYVPSLGAGFRPTLLNLLYFPVSSMIRYPFNRGGLVGGEFFIEFLIKSSLFGEWEYPGLESIGRILLALCLLSMAVTAACLFLLGKDFLRGYGGVLALNFLVPLLMEVEFRFEYPVACTQDFRYIAPVLISTAYFTGYSLQKPLGRPGGILKPLLYAVSGAFAAVSAVFVLLLGHYE